MKYTGIAAMAALASCATFGRGSYEWDRGGYCKNNFINDRNHVESCSATAANNGVSKADSLVRRNDQIYREIESLWPGLKGLKLGDLEKKLKGVNTERITREDARMMQYVWELKQNEAGIRSYRKEADQIWSLLNSIKPKSD